MFWYIYIYRLLSDFLKMIKNNEQSQKICKMYTAFWLIKAIQLIRQ